MSLKLGDTNIAGTQILYSTTGNNTDGAMTQATTTTQLNLKANDADAVHKTGNETITGLKTLKNTEATIANPPNITSWRFTDYTDNNNERVGVIGSQINPDGWHGVYLQAGNEGNIYIITDGTDVISYAPACDADNSIVTTVNKSKAENGYFKLGNGLIIQWGRSNQRTFTYPIPFSSDTSFSIVVNNQAGTDGYGRPDSVDNLTRTSCMVSSLVGYPVRWLAIGY